MASICLGFNVLISGSRANGLHISEKISYTFLELYNMIDVRKSQTHVIADKNTSNGI